MSLIGIKNPFNSLMSLITGLIGKKSGEKQKKDTLKKKLLSIMRKTKKL